MEDETLEKILNYLLTKFKDIKNDQSPDLLQKLTLSQYKNLARIDVETITNLSKGLESYLSEYLEIVNLETQLKQKKCALGEKLKQLDAKFDEAIEGAKGRSELLKNGDFDFLNPKLVVEKTEFAKPAEHRRPIPVLEPTYSTRVPREPVSQQSSVIDSVMKPPNFTSLTMSSRKEKKDNVEDFLNPKPVVEKTEFAKPSELKMPNPTVEPTYSTRVLREPVSQQPSVIDSVMKPPTFTSLAMSSRKERKENVEKTKSFDLDDSLLNGHEISVINISDERRRLQFDELDDDDQQTPARHRVFSQRAKIETPARTPSKATVLTDRKPLDPYTLPPPPVFSSNTGRALNQNRE
uniref:Spindle pole body component SPC42 n=1 Tax=Caenorhabditis tropicalis TaxID=1561998 RepID=A0A1I7UMF5_9PELO